LCKKSDSTVQARKILHPLWEESDLRGRCWGLRRSRNSFAGTNIIFALGEELVSVSMNSSGQLVVHQFKLVKETTLGTSVKNLLQANGLSLAE
jgi:hypothetical protein